MSEPSLWSSRFILEREPADLEVVDDELFMDLQDAPGTQFLAATCYGQAVRECLRIGEDHYILRVNRDMRMLLLRQLKFFYKTFQVYRYAGEDESRVLLTGELHIWFAPSSTVEERRQALAPGIEDEDVPEEPANGIYRLRKKVTSSPVAMSIALERADAVRQATPIIVELPPTSVWVSQKAPLEGD